MTRGRPDVDVAVIGAGATGLFLAARLAQAGVSVRVLEARSEPTLHSRAIGIHPPGLEALDRLGVVSTLVEKGVQVRRGRASGGDPRIGIRSLGELSFDATLSGPHRYVLTVPQWRTEAALEAVLNEAAPGALVRGAMVEDWREDGDVVAVRARTADGDASLSARALVACTGAGGDAAERLGIDVDGGRYGDVYVMGDAVDDRPGPDGTPLGPDAAIHLAPGGVVEAFPLPGGVRRWVVKTPELVEAPSAAELVDRVAERCGVRPDPDSMTMVSSFGVQRRLARRFVVGRVSLAGDAAHVVAPIGGQGMTLGWLGAERWAAAWLDHAGGRRSWAEAAAVYERDQRAEARRAMRRAAWNLRMGRARRFDLPRRLLVRVLVSPPFAARMARTFTMQA